MFLTISLSRNKDARLQLNNFVYFSVIVFFLSLIFGFSLSFEARQETIHCVAVRLLPAIAACLQPVTDLGENQ